MKPAAKKAPPQKPKQSKRTQALKHTLWKASLLMRGKSYRLTQIRRVVQTTLEHLNICAEARVMEVACIDREDSSYGKTGLVVAITWEHSLPAFETAILNRYIASKVQIITGLSYAQQDVFFESYLPPKMIVEKQVNSWWLRERIYRITSSSLSSRPPSKESASQEYAGRSQATPSRPAPFTPADAAALVAELRRRINQTRFASKANDAGSVEFSLGHETDGDEAMIEGYLTVHADVSINQDADALTAH